MLSLTHAPLMVSFYRDLTNRTTTSLSDNSIWLGCKIWIVTRVLLILLLKDDEEEREKEILKAI